jgi:hypothetical protein
VNVAARGNLRVEWLEDGVLKKTCAGFVSSEDVRWVYETARVEFVRRGGSKILSDNRQLLPASRELLSWIEHEWAPRMAAGGWRHWAVLEPATPLGAMSARRWVQIYRRLGVEVAEFVDEREALAWLRTRQVAPPRSGRRGGP